MDCDAHGAWILLVDEFGEDSGSTVISRMDSMKINALIIRSWQW